MKSPFVAVIMGSDSDLPVMEAAIAVLDYFAIPYEVTVTSAHRTPEKTHRFAQSARERGVDIIIAGAGFAAHLAGVVASETTLPVIGVPIDSSSLHGVDALLSTAQMPGGIPVATMSLGKAGAKNAAIFAARMLALTYPEINDKLITYNQNMQKEFEVKAQAVAARFNPAP